MIRAILLFAAGWWIFTPLAAGTIGIWLTWELGLESAMRSWFSDPEVIQVINTTDSYITIALIAAVAMWLVCYSALVTTE